MFKDVQCAALEIALPFIPSMQDKARQTVNLSKTLMEEFKKSLPPSVNIQGAIEASMRLYLALPRSLQASIQFGVDSQSLAELARHLIDSGELPAGEKRVGRSDVEPEPKGLSARKARG